MYNRVLKSHNDLGAWIGTLSAMQFPVTVSAIEGEKRTNPQNKTINMWYTDAARHLGDCTHEDIRAECKLMFGVPILRRDNAAFLLSYDADFKPFSYEVKRKLFKALEPAITSKMNKTQLTEYMERMQQHFAKAGVILRDPEARKYEGQCDD